MNWCSCGLLYVNEDLLLCMQTIKTLSANISTLKETATKAVVLKPKQEVRAICKSCILLCLHITLSKRLNVM